jgi:Histidine kinase-like ATPase domain
MNRETGITDLMHKVVAASVAPGPVAEITLPGVPASVPGARRLVRDALSGCPRADDLMLVATELASNAVAHSSSGHGGTITVRVRTAPQWARVEVFDDGPVTRSSSRGNGWGLAIVAGVTERSGATMQLDGGRKAWGEVRW